MEKKDIQLKENELYFLTYLNFKILKTRAKKSFDSGLEITVDLESGKVTFPNCVKILKDELLLNSKTIGAVYFICNKIEGEKAQDFRLYFDKRKKSVFEIYYNSAICINKRIEKIRDDLLFPLRLLENNVNEIYSLQIRCNAREKVFCNASGMVKTNKIISDYALFYPLGDSTIKERVDIMKKAKEFNKKLQNIKRFDFRFGNAFCGIKKLSIYFYDDIMIKSNSGKCLNENISREEIIKELENFCFINWKQKYDGNKKPILENAWTIELMVEDERLEFRGLDDYPKIWPYVEWFVKKYGGFIKIRE